jgi:cell division protein FtsL
MPLPHYAGAYGAHTLLRNGPEGGIADMMRTRQTGQKNNKMIYVAAVLIIILTAAGIWMWRDKPDPPPVVNTDTAIEELREELAASQRRIDELDKTIREEASKIREQEHAYVDSLGPDDVALAVSEELRIFLSGD